MLFKVQGWRFKSPTTFWPAVRSQMLLWPSAILLRTVLLPTLAFLFKKYIYYTKYCLSLRITFPHLFRYQLGKTRQSNHRPICCIVLMNYTSAQAMCQRSEQVIAGRNKCFSKFDENLSFLAFEELFTCDKSTFDARMASVTIPWF